MRLIRFPQGDSEVLIDPEKVSHVKKEIASGNMIKAHAGETIVYVIFGGTEWVRFVGKDAENVWDYFAKYN